MMCAGVKPPGDNWIRTGKWMSASVIWTSVHNIAHKWWWSVRSEICRIGDRNYLRLPTADFERMSRPDASVHSRTVVPLGGQQWPAGECTEVTQCAGSVRACAARGSEARGEGHCASCQLLRSGVMPPASVKESEMWQNHHEWELLIVTPKTGENFLACLM